MLLITPPFTQLNTPYPATAYLKGFFNTIGLSAHQMDLGILTLLQLFSKQGLTVLFARIRTSNIDWQVNEYRILHLESSYLSTIDPVIQFLQNKNASLAYSIVERGFLPEASRFDQIDDLEWAFGNMGIQDKARHLATLYLEDLSDLIRRTIDPHFGFSRYAERLSLSAVSFDPLYEALLAPLSYVDELMLETLDNQIKSCHPSLICFSIPFPGNLYSALRCGSHIKIKYPTIPIAIGGGYPNTELRSLTDIRFFEFVDYITLDDGEKPLELLLKHIANNNKPLKRTLTMQNGLVTYIDNSDENDVPFSQVGTPDYEGLALDQYLSVIEITNPMHRLWSDGRWNKLTMAHGCYWKKCTFCDVSLSYIKDYDPVHATLICDRMEEQIAQTRETGFHFVDEAAPPALMRDLALEILKRNLKVTWWTNIRFEKRFTLDLCLLLNAAGCIAVSGGLEVASDRLLKKINKGVTVSQVAEVTDHFTQAGIMVHAYLMYGFPTQTAQETVDSLEMVRQMFEHGIIQSGYWHQFSMTAHSPVGQDPAAFGVSAASDSKITFAHNDLIHKDPSGADHQLFSGGLKKSLYNYMHGTCFDFDLQKWFDFEIPTTNISPYFIAMILQNSKDHPSKNAKLVWLHTIPQLTTSSKKYKRKKVNKAVLNCVTNTDFFECHTDQITGDWLMKIFDQIASANIVWTMEKLRLDYEENCSGKFEGFCKSEVWINLRSNGLLLV